MGGSVAPLLLAVSLSPQIAGAECGSYVLMLNHDGSVKQAAHDSPSDPTAPHTPCHGPNCSKVAIGPVDANSLRPCNRRPT